MLYCGEMIWWLSFDYESNTHVLEDLGNVWGTHVFLIIRVHSLFASLVLWPVSWPAVGLSGVQLLTAAWAAPTAVVLHSEWVRQARTWHEPECSAWPVSSSQQSYGVGAPLSSWGSRSFVGLQRSHLQIPLFVKISSLYFITQLV